MDAFAAILSCCLLSLYCCLPYILLQAKRELTITNWRVEAIFPGLQAARQAQHLCCQKSWRGPNPFLWIKWTPALPLSCCSFTVLTHVGYEREDMSTKNISNRFKGQRHHDIRPQHQNGGSTRTSVVHQQHYLSTALSTRLLQCRYKQQTTNNKQEKTEAMEW